MKDYQRKLRLVFQSIWHTTLEEGTSANGQKDNNTSQAIKKKKKSSSRAFKQESDFSLPPFFFLKIYNTNKNSLTLRSAENIQHQQKPTDTRSAEYIPFLVPILTQKEHNFGNTSKTTKQQNNALLLTFIKNNEMQGGRGK